MEQGLMMINRTDLITSSLLWTPSIHPSIHVPSQGSELWPGSNTGGDGWRGSNGAVMMMTNRTDLITSSLSWTPSNHLSIHVQSQVPELWPGSKTGGDGWRDSDGAGPDDDQ